ETETPLFFFGHASAAWLSRDWSATGVFGDATIATAAKGEQILAAAVDRLVPLITAISRFDVPAPDAGEGA
ncbi:MAG: creatininase family protein, partial [Caldilineaceae bacterium]|nr:creatininase family protein [Caldilineaceae bacterium]